MAMPAIRLPKATRASLAESELLVQDALAQLMLNRTSFVIAHRLSTVRRADAIIVLENGRVREIGRHEELLADPDSHYARLYAMQLFDRTPSAAPPASLAGGAAVAVGAVPEQVRVANDPRSVAAGGRERGVGDS